jgi:putative ABC transport system substrate-binding protein
MRRREFISLLGGAVIVWPGVIKAQGAFKRPLVAVLLAGSSTNVARYLSGLPQGLHALGYEEGRNIDFVYRYGDGDITRMPVLAEELVRLEPDVIVCGTTSATIALKQATATIPIVNLGLLDPEGFGFVKSLARPGGQVTGILITIDSLAAKLLQIVLEVVPGASSIGLLLNVSNPSSAVYRQNVEAAAAKFARKLIPVEVRVPDGLDAGFRRFVSERVELVLIFPDGTLLSERRRIAALATTARLPTMFGLREHVEAGGLMSYGIDLHESYRHSALFVNKILKGAKPGDLPVELPTKFELAVNMKTAKALGITFPPSIMVRADEVID